MRRSRYYRDDYDDGWPAYVPVAERKRLATAEAKRRCKKGESIAPVAITGTQIATTFWGKAWCKNLEHYSDYANRLPRGRTYARNGSIVDLKITQGKISAIVAGSSPYNIHISIKKLDAKRWGKLVKDCAKSIHSVIDLMRGKLPDDVLCRLADSQAGMFPAPREISLSCDCPDGASLCKHLAAVMYGIGNRLDTEPELFFRLRGVDQKDLISEALTSDGVDTALGLNEPAAIDDGELESIFGIDLAVGEATGKEKRQKKATKKRSKKTADKPTKKKAVQKKVTKKKVVKKEPTQKKAAKKAVKKRATRKQAK